nr:MAG TPA: hypothetical protein [Caudoviricetes sp.]
MGALDLRPQYLAAAQGCEVFPGAGHGAAGR